MNGNAIIDGTNKLLSAMRKSDGTYRTYDEMVKENIPTKYLGVFDTTGMGIDLDPNTGVGDPTPTYSYGFFLAEVEVDTATGKTTVLSMALEQDIGPVGSMQAVDGQSYGGLVQGVGMALSEDYYDVTKHINLIACGLPYIMDAPDNMEIGYQETPRTTGPHGSTGCAELHLSAPHTAILNALHNACGVKIHALPATPDKVLSQLKILKEKGTLPADKRYWLGLDLNETIQSIKENPIALKSGPRGPAV
jgi:aldehyde oxidoreductase